MAVTSGSFVTNEVSYVYNGTTIKTKFTLAWSVTNTVLTNNQYTINVKLTQNLTPSGYQRTIYKYYVTVDGTTTSNTYSSGSVGYDGTVWADFNQTITMNDDGNKSVAFKVGVAVGGTTYNCSGTQTFQMGTIPRYSTLTIPTLTMGSSAVITVNQAISSFYSIVGITYNNNYTEFPAQTGSSFTVSWTPTDITSSVTTSDHADAVIQCWTYFDSNLSEGGLLTEETAPVYVPSSVVPSVSISSVAEANPNLSGLPYIVGYSLLTVTFTFTGNTGSTFSSASLTCGSETVTGNSLTLTTTVPVQSTSNTATVTVYDSRGRSASASQTVNAVNYSAPTITLDLTRMDANNDPSPLGTYLSVKAKWEYASITGNSATITSTVSGTSQNYTPTVSSQTTWAEVAYFSNVSVLDEITVSATITDAIASANATITLPKAIIPFSLYQDNGDVGVTLGRTAIEEDAHVYMPVHLYDSQTIEIHDANDTTHTATDVLFWDSDSEVTNSVVTKTSGVCSLSSSSARRFGKVVTIHFAITGTSTQQTAGTNVFVGTVPSEFCPSGTVGTVTYYSSYVFIAVITSSGEITVRNMSRTGTNTTLNFTFSFVQ